MLQQILKDLYVDPEILAELDDEQKQMLFVKMRAEQVRRWNEREDEFEKEVINNPYKQQKKNNGKKVNFLQGRDGCDWVWVMGEHKNDLTIEEILQQEAQKKALALAEKEAEALRQKEEEELRRKIEAEKTKFHEENERLERELKEKEKAVSQSSDKAKEEVIKISQLRKQYEEMEQQRLNELNEEQKRLRRRSQDAVETVKKRRSCELYIKWKEKREEIEKQAEESSKLVEESFKVQEVKAKEAEKEMKEMAQRARIEYKESLRRTNNIIQAAKTLKGPTPPSEKPPLPPKKHLYNSPAVAVAVASPAANGTEDATTRPAKPRPLRPRSRNMVIDWFIKEEKDKGSGLDPATGKIASWFHGVISRQEAEKLLAERETGAFVVRVSERVWGYTISYKEKQRCKHFLIDATDLGFQFFGANQLIHKSLAELVAFHKETPITISGRELLVYPVGQTADPPDYCELFQGNKSESTAL